MAYSKPQKINEELFQYSKNQVIELFEISDIRGDSSSIYFYGGINNFNEGIIFDGKTYIYLPFSGEDFATRGDGKMNRPKIKIINHLGLFSKYIKNKDDLLRARVHRTRTFVKFLDKENFLNFDEDYEYWYNLGIDPDPSAIIKKETWLIAQKINENKNYIEYELANALDLDNITLPRRKIINNYCSWKYRGSQCGFTGPPIADSNNVKFENSMVDRGEWVAGTSYTQGDFVYLIVEDGVSFRPLVFVAAKDHTSSQSNRPTLDNRTWLKDECSKNLNGCKMRFKGAPNEPLPFGGFPSSRLF